jgi:hypothetical protein
MREHDDQNLRSRFEALRAQEVAGAASFQATLAAARRRRVAVRGLRTLVVAVAGVVAGTTVGLLLARHVRPRGVIALAAVRWYAPTDFLLKLPGAELLRSTPQFGRIHLDWRTP